ncbi:MAG: TIGR01777 family oxidoreductase [Thermoguttaceae bacterium]|nr:TIGR01777 family oxidoreductase [Thermoguttaceae bacterium]MDW8080177.1 TIGR01777 family oxidoreductase [Thermoguttaceae bacterium]
MRILISGSSGLIGRAVVAHLVAQGHQITRLVRGGPSADRPAVYWDPLAEYLDPLPLEGFDAVIHLAGENIAARRWTPQQKDRIYRSRVQGTKLLSKTLAHLNRKPRVFLSASAVGYYGNRGDQLVDETAPAGSGFLATVARDWEEATAPAGEAQIRTVILRFGAVLSVEGGILPRLIPVFRWGLGGVLGPGTQYVSWVSLSDVLRVVSFLLTREDISGPVNITAPEPVTNRQLTKALARVLRRPAVFWVPAFALRMMLGEMAHELLLCSIRAIPRKLEQAGFTFQDREFEPTVRQLLAGK